MKVVTDFGSNAFDLSINISKYNITKFINVNLVTFVTILTPIANLRLVRPGGAHHTDGKF